MKKLSFLHSCLRNGGALLLFFFVFSFAHASSITSSGDFTFDDLPCMSVAGVGAGYILNLYQGTNSSGTLLASGGDTLGDGTNYSYWRGLQTPLNLSGCIANIGTIINNSSLPDGAYFLQYAPPGFSFSYSLTRSGGIWTAVVPPPLDTRIDTVTPADHAVVGTSTAFTFGVTGYLSDDDYNNGNNQIHVNLSYTQSAGAHLYSFAAVPSCRLGILPNTNICQDFVWTLNSPGLFSVSTTTVISAETGRYNMDSSISGTQLWILHRTLAATSTIFTIVQASGLDLLGDRIAANFASTTASSTLSLSSCNPFSGFDPMTCFLALTVPSVGQLKEQFTSIYNGAFQAVPLGYVTRFITLISSATAVEPPALTYKFGSSSPAILRSYTSSDPVTFQIFDHFTELGSIKADDGTNKGIWDIIMPWFNTFVILAVLLVILEDLLGWQITSDLTQETSVEQHVNPDGSSFTTTTKHTEANASATFQNVTKARHVDRFKRSNRRDA